MKKKIMQIFILLLIPCVTFACQYIVLPELDTPAASENSEFMIWTARVTQIDTLEGGVAHIEMAIQNDTGDWSKMQAVPNKPAVLTTSDGRALNCDSVFVGTGGHRLAPGFQMRGYTTGKKESPTLQLLYVECKNAGTLSGAKLTIEYESYQGILDDYDPEANQRFGKLELNLDEVSTDLVYPVAKTVDGLIQEPGVSITALSDNVVTLLDVQRTETGFQFKWQNYNPSKFPLKTHIGIPPVIGSDGIIYGVYEIIDLAPVPITPAKENMVWTTEVSTPQGIKGFYILLSVESKKPRTYVNYAIDISEK